MGRRRNRPRSLEPIELETTGLGEDGRARGVHAGRTVLVTGGLADETLRVRLTGRSRGRDEGEAIEVLRPSHERVEPRCPHFGTCGGCRLQHQDPGAALRHKQERLLARLERAGVVAREVLPPLRGPAWGYRRRARLGIKWVEGKGKVLVGFRERDDRFVADLAGCEILAGDAGRLIPPISALVDALSMRTRVPQVEVTVADDVTALVFRVLEEPGPDDLGRLSAFGRAHQVQVHVQPGGPSSVRGLDESARELVYRLPDHDVELAFAPTDFIQVNGALNRAMVDLVVARLELRSTDRVLDLFCGLGNFTLPVARRVRAVVGVEGDEGLVTRARANAARNGVHNVQFSRIDLYADTCTNPIWERPWDAALLDPPRSGAGAVLDRVGGLSVRRLVYVSCGPDSFVADAARLVAAYGFDLIAVGVMDMFPHTAHVETIGVFAPS